MKMKKWMTLGAICLTAVMVLSGCGSSDSGEAAAAEAAETSAAEVTEETTETFKIGVTQIVEHPALDGAREGFKAGLAEAGIENIEFVEENAQGDMATAQMIAQGFVDSKVDMIYAIATPTAQAAYNATKDIPIMISAVTDPVAAGLAESMEASNTNVSGTSDEAPVNLQLELLTDLGLTPKTIGFIYNTSEKNSEVQLEVVTKEAEKLGWNVEPLGITSLTEMEQGLDVLLDKVDILYAPTDNMVASAIQLVSSKAIAKGVPVLGAEPALVEGGALATCGVDYFELGRQTGLMAAKVLDGEDVSTLPLQKALNPEIVVNEETAKALNIDVSGIGVN